MNTIVEKSQDSRWTVLRQLVLGIHDQTNEAYALAKEMGVSLWQFQAKCREWGIDDAVALHLAGGYQFYLQHPTLAGDEVQRLIKVYSPKPKVKLIKETRHREKFRLLSKHYKARYSPHANQTKGTSRAKSAIRQLKGGGWTWKDILMWVWEDVLKPYFKGGDIDQYELKLMRKDEQAITNK